MHKNKAVMTIIINHNIYVKISNVLNNKFDFQYGGKRYFYY